MLLMRLQRTPPEHCQTAPIALPFSAWASVSLLPQTLSWLSRRGSRASPSVWRYGDCTWGSRKDCWLPLSLTRRRRSYAVRPTDFSTSSADWRSLSRAFSLEPFGINWGLKAPSSEERCLPRLLSPVLLLRGILRPPSAMRRSLVRVNRVVSAMSAMGPLYPQEPTSIVTPATSEKCRQ